LSHVTAQAALQRRQVAGRAQPVDKLKSSRLPKNAFVGMLAGLRNYIAGMRPPSGKTVWADYANSTSYTDREAATKRAFVQEMVGATRPSLLFDLGCNTGDYSEAALEAGAAQVVGFDFDYATLDRAFDRFSKSGRPVLPLWMDAANPSPSQGWAQAERKGLQQRARADALIALAFIHHIVIGRNVPLDMAVEWITGLAPVGIIEFPPKDDPMVQRLLMLRQDIFPDYTEEAFLASINARARVVGSRHVSENGRLLVWYERPQRRS
jgi:ribosomal protein L11 methylase PrmA